ncbi:peptide-methionine (S)-S-oxide reductase [Aquimarina sp. MMG015]|uniref:peptide-methionine (S)-S-oxide reductase n=1 Tax=unclassified Aquimarina TaxID=2627091 RepID=UPI000E4AD0C8|nr:MULTISPECIES: peptide-methionine (S)-S-oxide reductase [unclassified Aquimarina]AXT56317.1 peptide methionine sulfoxide reductase [Aquimarina sp. AD1]MBQ4803578.1 peptide-methionine (S)-S-oxide reductase [Aquimarina sp. MMG015]
MGNLKIGLGGGCHWCTEAVFQSLKGITSVEQGYIKSTGNNNSFSEAVIIVFSPEIISLKDLIEIHLLTHKSTSNHSFREKYRSAIYYFKNEQKPIIETIIIQLNENFQNRLITKVLKFNSFKPSRTELTNYYKKDPKKPFCIRYIQPKLEFLRNKYWDKMNF